MQLTKTTSQTENTNIKSFGSVFSPKQLKDDYPLSEADVATILNNRNIVQDILSKKDPRIFAVVGPCSIHDYDQAIEYAHKLKVLADQVKDKIFIIMRVYFEKPRTTVGWKGLINDPNLDGSFDIQKGMKLARKLMLQITRETGLAIGTEALDPISPQYLNDLVSWNAIGARTTESQTHREMASGLSAPVGFKNGTDGSIDIAVNAMLSSKSQHSFFGVDDDGKVSIVTTNGNKYGHIILRGGENGPNYSAEDISNAANELAKANLPCNIVVDCSHANSSKDYRNQSKVFDNVISQIESGNKCISGLMIESNINAGNQKLVNGQKDKLEYGVSITDACISFAETEHLIVNAYNQL